MTLTQSSSDANNGARQRFELELLLQRAVPNPDQLRRRGIRATELRTATEPSNSKSSPADHGASRALGFDLSRALEKTPGVKEKAIFASKLAALVDADVPIVRSLDLIATQQKLPMFKRALIKVSLDVNEGIALATAIRQWPKVFDQLSVAMVEAGEAGGVLDEALKRLAKPNCLKTQQNFKTKSKAPSDL